ncbi:hypothetical protein DBR42_17620 [Pelomonas sp. HMWF004]|nr:hypothetical protein DBR42_17620 [Pelomonas sp. HMWF004]
MCTFQGVTCLDAYGVTRAADRQPAVGISGAQDLVPGTLLGHAAIEAVDQQLQLIVVTDLQPTAGTAQRPIGLDAIELQAL